MKITKVEAIHLSLAQTREIADGTQDALIVKVHTDEGIVGIGDAHSSPHVIKAIIEAPLSHLLCSGLARLIVGEDPLQRERLWHRMYRHSLFYGRRGAAIHAISGIDTALWDIAGKAAGQPIYKLLGGGFCEKVRAYASVLFGDTPEETAERAREAKQRGFTAAKFGWGPIGQDLKTDLAHLAAAREALGNDIDLLVDIGCLWDAKTAIQRAKAFEQFNIFWLEEPLPPDDLDGYARLSQATNVRIAAGEEESTRWGFADLMDRGKIDIVQPDVARAGGLSESMRIAYMAHQRNKPCVPHAWGTESIIATSLHLIASIPNHLFLEYCIAKSPLRDDLFRNPCKFENGYAYVPQGPGLGVELDEEVVEKYRVQH